MSRSITAEVAPEVLRWARETAGVEVADVARRKPLRRVEEWERGSAHPTISQLEALSDLYRRPLATFFLPRPPRETPLPTDFRTLPGEQRPISRRVRLAIRAARRIQRLYAELAGDARPRSSFRAVTTDDNPEEVGALLRGILRVRVREQTEWSDTYTALRAWRRSVEEHGILTLQLTMPPEDARGFSLTDGPVPTLVVSSSDAVAARCFTLFHELAHVLLRDAGICVPQPDGQPVGVERFCNQFSGAFLVPLDALLDRVALGPGQHPTDEDVTERSEQAARMFKVSRQVIVWRLRTADAIPERQFRRLMTRWADESTTRRGGFQSPASKAVSQLGPTFVSTVLEAQARGAITASDVSDYLSVKVRHIPQVERLLAAEARG